MQAQVNDECPWGIVTALEGNEYTRRDWRPVPAGKESEAEAHPWLIVRDDPEPIILLSDDGITANFDGPITGPPNKPAERGSIPAEAFKPKPKPKGKKGKA